MEGLRESPREKEGAKRKIREAHSQILREAWIHAVGFWESKIGGTTNKLYYMLAFEDLDHLDKAWNSFREDPEWQGVAAESEKDGPLVTRMTNMILTPTDYSPMK